METLLRLKHWQIFMLTFGVLMISLIFQVIINISGAEIFGPLDDSPILARIVALVSVATAVVTACYLYIVGMKLAEKRPYDNLNENLFKTSLYFMTAYSAAQNIIFPLIRFDATEINFLLGIASLAAGLYCDYFVAKALKSVELDRETIFDDFTGDFFSFVFFPIGVWWLQPRINKIFDKDANMVDPDAPLDQHVNIEKF